MFRNGAGTTAPVALYDANATRLLDNEQAVFVPWRGREKHRIAQPIGQSRPLEFWHGEALNDDC